MSKLAELDSVSFREDQSAWLSLSSARRLLAGSAQLQWHQDQKLALLADGAVSLAVPYSHTKEILMEILRYGADVEVLAPAELRELVAAVHRDAASIYHQPRRAPAREAGKRLKSAVAS